MKPGKGLFLSLLNVLMVLSAEANDCRDYQEPYLFAFGYDSITVEDGNNTFLYTYKNNLMESAQISQGANVHEFGIENIPDQKILKFFGDVETDTTYYFYNEDDKLDSSILVPYGLVTYYTKNENLSSETTFDAEGNLVGFDSIFYNQEGRVEIYYQSEVSNAAYESYCQGSAGICVCYYDPEFTDTLNVFYHSEGKLDSALTGYPDAALSVFTWVNGETTPVGPLRQILNRVAPPDFPIDILGRKSGLRSRYFRL